MIDPAKAIMLHAMMQYDLMFLYWTQIHVHTIITTSSNPPIGIPSFNLISGDEGLSRELSAY